MKIDITQQVLGVSASPYPVSFGGSGVLFCFALFSLIVISSLALMLGGILGRHIYKDRGYGFDAVAAIRVLVAAVCLVAIMRCVPEVTYMASYAEASHNTLQNILTVKRLLDSISLFPVLFWMAIFWIWYPDIVLKLRSKSAFIWQDHKLSSLKRFISVVSLSAALALAITLGVAVH